MGLIKFINNIRYLARYNLKEMHRKKDIELNYKEFRDIIKLIPYFDNTEIVKVNILNVEKTIDLLISTNKSMVRYGDGEFSIMDGKSIPFQIYDIKLSSKLKKIIRNNNENILVGLGNIFYKIQFNKYTDTVQDFILRYVAKEHEKLEKFIDKNKQYVSAEVTIMYQHYMEYNFEEHFNKIKKIWENKEIVIVCGETVFKNIDYNIFDNSKSIDYIYAPSKNAFDKYDELLLRTLKYDKNKLFIIILGPTANILAYDLANKGYRALDLGHIAKDYDAYVKNTERTKENIDKFYEPD